MKRIKGFTLVELLIVVAIIGILAAVLLLGINPIEQTRKAQDSGLLSRCKEAVSAGERYFAFHDSDPANCAALITADELKDGSCDDITLISADGSYTCTFQAKSTAFQAADKCNGTTCTVPDDFQ